MIADTMPDLSHLSAEEREIIEQVFQRQRAEEQKEEEIAQKADKELDDIEKLISDRKENARRLVGTQNDAICQICQKTKFADGIGHKCFHCELRSCARCGGRTTHKNRNIWACSTCQKRQELYAKSGKWFQGNQPTANEISPATSQTIENPGGMDEYAAQQELQNQQQHVNGSSIPMSGSQQQMVNDRRRQNSIHKQASIELEPQKMNGSVHTGAQPVHHQAPLNQTHIQQQKPQPAPHQTTHHQMQPTNDHVNQQRTSTTAPQITSHQTTHMQPTNDHLNQQRVATTTPQQHQQRTETTPQQQKISEQQRSSQLKSQRSYDAHSIRPRTETIPEYTNGHQPSAHTSSRSPVGPNARPRTSEKLSRHEAARQAKHAQRMPAAVPPGSSSSVLSGYHQRQVGPSVLSGNRMRRGKLSRQIRSLSSSEDDDAQAIVARRHSAMEPDFSEKDLLKYIYGNQRFQKPPISAGGVGFTNSLPGSRTGLYDAHSSNSNPALNNYTLSSATLATKIRQFLQPVSWQPSADQRRLIGHVVLQRPETDSGDLGLKVIGGRHSSSGRLGAFITQVKPGSVGDIIGQLRPGDEVLEWNGDCLQNLTHDGVYQIISASKNSPKIELIVSRSAHSPPIVQDDHLNYHRSLPQQQSPIAYSDVGASIPHTYVSDHYRIPHSKSLVNPQMAYMQDPLAGIPIAKHMSPHRGPNLGKMEFSILYLSHEHELLITIYQAVDLPPRSTGALRNPYVKVFLLPNRSEESRRQSKILYETLNPAWNECFFYYGVMAGDLNKRALEITVWDYDQYNGHEFIGETVIDLSQILLDNQHFSYPLVDDTSDENPLRMRLRQSRMNSPYTPAHERYRSQSASCDDYRQREMSHQFHHQMPMAPMGYNYPPRDMYEPDMGHRSKYDEMEWNGYLSDHGQYQRPPNSYYHRRPRSATGFRHIAEYESRNAYRNQPITEEVFDEEGRLPGKLYDYHQADRTQPFPGQPIPQAQHSSSPSQHIPPHQGKKVADGMEFMSNRQRELIMQEQSGYGSDGSETLSANSAQSMQKRAANREEEQLQANLQDIPHYSPRHHFYENPANSSSNAYGNQRYGHRQNHGQRMAADEMQYKMNNGRMDENQQRLNGGGQQDLGVQSNGAGSAGTPNGPGSVNALSMKERKKSLMTRLIPGRNAPNDVKRTGFARSEEVGIPTAGMPDSLSVNQNGDPDGVAPFMKQSSKDSTDSSHSDNFQPVLPDGGTLGQFVDNLGPGQVVGRQALASPVLGEIQICLYIQDGALIVDIKRAKNLVIRPGTKINPAPYVKCYLMQGKQCIAKAKTQAVRKTTAPIFNQKLSFAESYKHRMLQISVLGDYGRMERKSFMGIAQIRLDDLPLGGSHVIDGWYKLFHNTSLAGTTAPIRKDSENSLMEM